MYLFHLLNFTKIQELTINVYIIYSESQIYYIYFKYIYSVIHKHWWCFLSYKDFDKIFMYNFYNKILSSIYNTEHNAEVPVLRAKSEPTWRIKNEYKAYIHILYWFSNNQNLSIQKQCNQICYSTWSRIVWKSVITIQIWCTKATFTMQATNAQQKYFLQKSRLNEYFAFDIHKNWTHLVFQATSWTAIIYFQLNAVHM